MTREVGTHQEWKKPSDFKVPFSGLNEERVEQECSKVNESEHPGHDEVHVNVRDEFPKACPSLPKAGTP